ncbi:hypothetical protein E2C01_021282 [Portunus trituberculatus]|uniref:Uncharacterized protein n=1 Tax=Portunus trituberculatus TaxID=210409 RepID=A0A5B7E413_PORTR|nr:hypothetical protein [Portunus trituberculatus]
MKTKKGTTTTTPTVTTTTTTTTTTSYHQPLLSPLSLSHQPTFSPASHHGPFTCRGQRKGGRKDKDKSPKRKGANGISCIQTDGQKTYMQAKAQAGTQVGKQAETNKQDYRNTPGEAFLAVSVPQLNDVQGPESRQWCLCGRGRSNYKRTMTETTTTASAGSAANVSSAEQGPSLLLGAYLVSPPLRQCPLLPAFPMPTGTLSHRCYVTPMQIKTFYRLNKERFHRRYFLSSFMDAWSGKSVGAEMRDQSKILDCRGTETPKKKVQR